MHHPIDYEANERDCQRAADILNKAMRVAVLTGAGVSAESGVPTFRGADGLWEGHAVEDVATPEAFARDPEMVWRFYNQRRARLWTVQPNPAHFTLAQMEQRWGTGSFTVATQNIDGLHRAAGSQRVLELHGNLTRVRCTGCGVCEERTGEQLPDRPECRSCGGLLRPDIVWFHEMLPAEVWHQAAESAADCEVFLVVGTSAIVYPAARLVPIARAAGARIIEINPEETAVTSRVELHLPGKAGEILPRVARLLTTPPSAS